MNDTTRSCLKFICTETDHQLALITTYSPISLIEVSTEDNIIERLQFIGETTVEALEVSGTEEEMVEKISHLSTPLLQHISAAVHNFLLPSSPSLYSIFTYLTMKSNNHTSTLKIYGKF